MNYINKINKYLLEHYPLIWNTRLFWMMLINIFTHLLFFIMGYSAIDSMSDLKLRYSLSDYFNGTSVIYYNYLISILMILVWVIFYLRNNAFKNFYKLQPFALFKEFCILIFILFISVSQYLSFEQGIMLKVRSSFNWEEVDHDIKTFNRTGVFLTQVDDDYYIKNKQYPAPFPLRMVSENENNEVTKIDTTRAYINYKGFRYQFFEIDKEALKKYRREDPYYFTYEYQFKHRIVKDVSEYKEHIDPTLLNYSKKLFSAGQDSLDYRAQIASHEQVLTQGSTEDIKKELVTMISLLNKYQVDHNLTVNKWLPLVDTAPLYRLTELIESINPKEKDGSGNNYRYRDIYLNEAERYDSSLPYSESMYCDFERLDSFFSNVHSAYFPQTRMPFIYILLGVIFFFGLLLFVFKTTDLKSLLLSIVGAIILLVIIVMLMSYLSYYRNYETRSSIEYNTMIVMMGSVILFAILAFFRKWKKIISTILTSLAVYAVPLLVMFASFRYENYLKDVHGDEYKEGFIIWFDENGFWFVMAFWFLAVLIYTLMIKELKARPE